MQKLFVGIYVIFDLGIHEVTHTHTHIYIQIANSTHSLDMEISMEAT